MILMWANTLKLCLFCINSLWPSDAIWRQGCGSTLAQVMACCLTAPSHYLNQCWLIICEVLWQLSEGNFTGNAQDIYIYPSHVFPNYRKLSNIRHTKSQNLNDSRLVLHLSLPGLGSTPEMELELELIFWRLAGVGVETSGVGVHIMELTPTLVFAQSIEARS